MATFPRRSVGMKKTIKKRAAMQPGGSKLPYHDPPSLSDRDLGKNLAFSSLHFGHLRPDGLDRLVTEVRMIGRLATLQPFIDRIRGSVLLAIRCSHCLSPSSRPIPATTGCLTISTFTTMRLVGHQQTVDSTKPLADEWNSLFQKGNTHSAPNIVRFRTRET